MCLQLQRRQWCNALFLNDDGGHVLGNDRRSNARARLSDNEKKENIKTKK